MIHAVLAVGLFGLYFPNAMSKVTADSICPVLEAKKDLAMYRFQGQWLSHGAWDSHGSNIECLVLTFKVANESCITIMERGYDPASGEVKIHFTNARIPDSTDPASWEVSVGTSEQLPADYLILDTDYFDYAVVYMCTAYRGERFFDALLLSKSPFLEKRRINEVLKSASRFGLNTTDFTPMDRDEANCYEKLNQRTDGPDAFRRFQKS